MRLVLPPGPTGLAVSGGSDSTALLVLAAEAGGGPFRAVTVDHGLRPEAAAEAAMVATLAARLGIPHDILHWRWDGQGNLMESARNGRRALIAAWAQGQGLPTVALAHTMDDQAETLLLNLARGSGVDGLSAMPAARREGDVLWLRPLLGARREALREVLRARGLGWAEDPSNDDPRYGRVRIRQAIPALGLEVPRLAATAARLQEARAVLEAVTQAAGRRLCRLQGGDILADREILSEPAEIRGRLLSTALAWVGGAGRKPRAEDLARLIDRLAAGQGGTLAGALITSGAEIRIAAEPARVVALRAPTPGPWDGRWRIHGAAGEIRALGPAGLALRPDWRAFGLPHASARALPGLWEGDRLLFAPVLDADGPIRAELDRGGVVSMGFAD